MASVGKQVEDDAGEGHHLSSECIYSGKSNMLIANECLDLRNTVRGAKMLYKLDTEKA